MAKPSDGAPPPRKHDHRLCCCGPDVRVHGRVSAKTVAVGAKVDLTQTIGLRVQANTLLNTSRQPGAVADSSSEEAVGLELHKPKDCVALTTTYEIHYELEGGCGPHDLVIETSGESNHRQQCQPPKGYIGVTVAKLFTGEAFFTRVRGVLHVVATVTDCEGRTAQCRFDLPEP